MDSWIAAAIAFACLGLTAAAPARAQADVGSDLDAVRLAWAIASYRTPPEGRLAAFEALRGDAARLAGRYPERAEVLIWDGIVLSSYANARGGLGALSAAREAKARFEAALALDERALGGAAHTGLGALHHRVPGFPVGFGSDAVARRHLERALEISPDAIDPNYYYGELLFDEGEYARAALHLERALRAPPRPGREVADEGRRAEVQALLAKVKAALPADRGASSRRRDRRRAA
jgi:tetratricopeptide (TPR) repeat protein